MMPLKARVTVVLCLAEILGMTGFATFSGLLPIFLSEWGLTNAQAGWVSGIYYVGYLVAVPVLVSWTDRADPRRILVLGTTLAGLSTLAFGVFAHGFWTALLLRFVAGMGLAGTYMPGLKALSDHTEGPMQSRTVAFYTSSFSIGVSLSYFLSGEVESVLGWRWSFGLASLGPLGAAILLATLVPARRPHPVTEPRRLLDFGPVVRRRPAMAYIIGYTAHVWELFSMRSWIVAFLVFSQELKTGGFRLWSATQVAAVVNLIGLPASLAGNELAVRYGRRRVVILIMIVSVAVSFLVGFSAPYSMPIVIGLSLVYGVTVMADSAALTAGAVAAAPVGHRGSTLAVHSTLGFGAGFLGSLTVGKVLDLAGGSTLAWRLAFITMGLGGAVGPLALAFVPRKERG